MSATELESLTKLKTAGKLRFWRGTIEIPEHELHSICDEIQAEHDRAIDAAMRREECEIEDAYGHYEFRCKECKTAFGLWDERPNYCPHCGRWVRR